MLLLLLSACELTPDELCAGKGPPSLELGPRTTEDFEPFDEGDDAELMEPPQGGLGLAWRGRSLGLVGNNLVDLEMSTEIDGEVVGEFVAEEWLIYCQEDGASLIWGTATPIDEELFPDASVLDGVEAVMRVRATGVEGDVAEAEVGVVIAVRE